MGVVVLCGPSRMVSLVIVCVTHAVLTGACDSLQEFIKSLVCLLQCMTDDDHTVVWGLLFFVDFEG